MIAECTRSSRPAFRAGVFASRFLESGSKRVIPDGHYDARRQVYVRRDTNQPAFVGEELGTEGRTLTCYYLTHYVTYISGVTVTDSDSSR